MTDGNVSAVVYLIVNRAEVVSEGCTACGQGFASEPDGARALSAAVGADNATYMFCAACGESIMSHLQTESVRQHYAWDWTVPLRGKPLANGGPR
jgi:hypothetical protein